MEARLTRLKHLRRDRFYLNITWCQYHVRKLIKARALLLKIRVI